MIESKGLYWNETQSLAGSLSLYTDDPLILDHFVLSWTTLFGPFFAIKIEKCKFFAFFDFFSIFWNRKIPLFSKFFKKLPKFFSKFFKNFVFSKFWRFQKIEKKSKNAKNLHFSIFTAKKWEKTSGYEQKKWLQTKGSSVYPLQHCTTLKGFQ